MLIEVLSSNNDTLNRGEMFGDGFFTTGIVKRGELINRDQHYERLQDSAERLNFVDWEGEKLINQLEKTAKKHPDSIIRVSCTRMQKERGYAVGMSAKTLCKIQIHSSIQAKSRSCYLSLAETPISINSRLAGIKHLNRLDNVLASSECQASDHEVLMCAGERVICGSRSNLFFKIDGSWVTPLISDCGINGIMKNSIVQKLESAQIECISRNIMKKELIHVSSAFVTNSIIGLWPVREINKTILDLNEVSELMSVLKFSQE